MQKIKALGMIEVYGRLGAVEALDACLKAAETKLIGMVKVGGGLSTVLVEGDVAAVKAAVDAGSAAARKVSRVISVHVIPRPHEEVWEMLREHDPAGSSGPGPSEPEPGASEAEPETKTLEESEPEKTVTEPSEQEKSKTAKVVEDLEELKTTKTSASPAEVKEPEEQDKPKTLAAMTVSALRKAARETEGFPMTKEEIKFAKKGELLAAFAKLNME